MAAKEASDGAGETFQARFDADVERHGLKLSPEELQGLAKLAAWMHDGLAQLPPTNEAAPDETVLDLPIPELGARLRNGQLTAVTLTQACLARIAARDPTYLCFYEVRAGTALAEAARADEDLAAGKDRGPLHGIPVGIKDLMDVAGMPTTANAPGRADAIAEEDAEVVRRLRAAGAVIIGKLATYEWGTVGPDRGGLFAPARNPWRLDRITGGSSSGCAAAVAGGLVRTSVGTDTGGSLRGPAFYCGTVGLKPTFGAVSTDGVLALAPSLDHVGPISASVAEAALTLDALTGSVGEKSALRLAGQPLAGLRIGYARDWFAYNPQVMPEVVAAMDAAVSMLSQIGAAVGEVDLPDYAAVEVAVAAILHAESFALNAQALRDRPQEFGRRAFLSLAAGLAVSEDELARARSAGRRFGAAVDALLERNDVLVTVGALTTALPVAPFEKEAVWTPMRTIGFNASGHPVLALPVGLHEGLPIGMQIIGRHYDEARIVQVGHAFEEATDIRLARPPAPS